MDSDLSGGGNVFWLTQTKLQPPRLREDVVARQKLLSELYDIVVSHSLTLVSAPAGYGKTTLLAELRQTFPDLSLAWLSLGQEDNDPACFLAGLVAAVQRVNPACGATAQVLLANLTNPTNDLWRIVAALVNSIMETITSSFVLVLEDLHMIVEPAIYVALDYLLEHLPAQMHLLVSSRHDPPLPLARLRARGQLAEVRLPSLRFTFDETVAFLNDRQRLNLTHEELALLHSGTEGWAAGLRLLASSLGQIPTSIGRTAFIAHLAKNNSYVFDFLADEVLDHQNEYIRTFLLETSILPELALPLCQAVTGRSNTAAILSEIYRRNLFVVAVDETGTTYRYHHLFAEFLRRRLAEQAPDRVAELHRRAAEAQVVPARAIPHFLAAQLWEEAAEAMEQVGDKIARDGLLNMLHGWILTLPDTVQEAHPRLIYYLGLCALQRGVLQEASSLFEHARSGFEVAGNEAGQGEALQQLVGVVSQQHDYERQALLISQALSFPLSTHGRVQLLMARAWQSVYEGRWTAADADLDEALQITLLSEDRQAFSILTPILRAHLALLPGGTERLQRFCRRSLVLFGDGIGPVQASAHSMLGYISFLQGRFDVAIQEAQRARAISQQLGGFTHMECEVDMIFAGSYSARGDHAAVVHYMETRLPWLDQTPAIQFWTVPFLYIVGRAQWMQDKLDQAYQTSERISAIVETQELPEATLSRALMSALLGISDRHYAQAENTLREAAALEKRMPHCLAFGSARLLLAHLHLLRGRPQEALTEITPVLAECERSDLPGLILREDAVVVPLLRLAVERKVHTVFALRLLQLLGAGEELGRAHVPDTGEILTPREVEVLRLIAAGASNKTITERMIISERTVKTHVTSILRKLNVTSRTQAAARARDLHLI